MRSQIASSTSLGRGRVDRARDEEGRSSLVLGQAHALIAAVDERREVRVLETLAQRQLRIEVLVVGAPVGDGERHDDVGPALLRADERLRVGLAPVELVEHLVGRVAPAGAVALHLPLPAQVLGRRQEDADVERCRAAPACGSRADPRRR